MSRLGSEVPNTVLPARIILRKIGRRNGAYGRRNLVLTATLFTIVAIFMKCKAIVAGTLIGAYRVLTLVLTTTIVVRAFIHVGEKDCGEACLLNTEKVYEQ